MRLSVSMRRLYHPVRFPDNKNPLSAPGFYKEGRLFPVVAHTVQYACGTSFIGTGRLRAHSIASEKGVVCLIFGGVVNLIFDISTIGDMSAAS